MSPTRATRSVVVSGVGGESVAWVMGHSGEGVGQHDYGACPARLARRPGRGGQSPFVCPAGECYDNCSLIRAHSGKGVAMALIKLAITSDLYLPVTPVERLTGLARQMAAFAPD